MFDHLELKVKDLAASTRFYQAALAPLGYVLGTHDESSAGFGPHERPALYLRLSRAATGPGSHVALRAQDRDAVGRFHSAGLAAGGRDHGAPGLRPDYGPHYYAAFLLDPDGNNIEAVCLDAS
jgi:catechol 2,3-dioxygenase-like lactoylglutathione lyase family enzyme